MNKYIRTKDGRFLENAKQDEGLYQGKITVFDGYYWCFAEDIIGQNDDIYMLIDSGDLVSYTNSLGKETKVINRPFELLVAVNSGKAEINRIYAKQNLNGKHYYVLVWEEDKLL